MTAPRASHRAGFSALGRRTEAPPISWLMEMTLARPHLISLAAGFTDNETLPVEEVRGLVDELLRRRRTGELALQYGSTPGLPELRQLTAEHLQALDGAAARSAEPYSPDRVLITHGSQQLLYLITEVLCDPGDLVLVEDPTYFVFLGIAQSHGLHCRGIRLEADGLDLQQLDETLTALRRTGELSRVKLIYLVSYFQNPTGTTMAFGKKQALLELLHHYERAAGHPIYVLEDSAYRELRFAGADEPSGLAAPRAAERVIYAGTYSKPFATGVRVGYGVLPAALGTIVVRVKGNHDFGLANFNQHIVARALASGVYTRHLEVLRRRYARKAAVMTRALRRHFPRNVTWGEPHGGMYVWASLPRKARSGPESAVFQAALERDVLYVPGRLCYAPDPTRRAPDREMRLSFGGARFPAITEGVRRLGEVLTTQVG